MGGRRVDRRRRAIAHPHPPSTHADRHGTCIDPIASCLF